MTTVLVEQLLFTFEAHLDPFQYEQGGAKVAGYPPQAKVVDLVANEPVAAPTVVWVIEAKDYRVIHNPPKPANLAGLAATMDAKVRSTIACLPTVVAAAPGTPAATHAAGAIAAGRKRVVLHLEPHPPTGAQTALFPAGFSASVLQKLKQLVKDIDTTALVLNIGRTPAAGVPWTVQ